MIANQGPVRDLLRGRAQLAAKEQQVAEIEKGNEAYKAEIARLEKSSYLEALARKQLAYAKPGEDVFIVQGLPPTASLPGSEVTPSVQAAREADSTSGDAASASAAIDSSTTSPAATAQGVRRPRRSRAGSGDCSPQSAGCCKLGEQADVPLQGVPRCAASHSSSAHSSSWPSSRWPVSCCDHEGSAFPATPARCAAEPSASLGRRRAPARALRATRPQLRRTTGITVPAGAPDLTVPILTYHYVDTSPPVDGPNAAALTVRTADFEAEMALLEHGGYHTVTFDQLWQAMAGGTPLPAKPVLLTFDDGGRDNYTVAFPILKRHGLVATFFVVTNAVDTNPQSMTWAQLREMRDAGMVIGSHTKGHPDLLTVSPDRLWDELAGSRSVIEAQLGTAPDVLAYPSGRFSAKIAELAQKAGYRMAVTTRWGRTVRAARMLEMPRMRVLSYPSVAAFELELAVARRPGWTLALRTRNRPQRRELRSRRPPDDSAWRWSRRSWVALPAVSSAWLRGAPTGTRRWSRRARTWRTARRSPRCST